MQVGFEHGSDDSVYYEHPYSKSFDALLLAHDSNCDHKGWWVYEVFDDTIEDGARKPKKFS